MNLRMRALSVVWVVLAVASSAHAKPYVDTKKRFSLDLPAGFELAPLPGDTAGMQFKKRLDDVPLSVHITVHALKPGETPKDSLDAAEAPFKLEIGYRAGGDVPVRVGGLSGLRRSLSVTASGDSKTVRAVELTVVHAYGFAHVVHMDTLESKHSAASRDVDKLLTSYQAIVGRAQAGPLVGRWATVGGPELELAPDGHFTLGPLGGTWSADPARLLLRLPQGEEPYRYTLDGEHLTLESANLDAPMKYTRHGGARVVEDDVTKPTPQLTRERLLGTWRVIDSASTDTLRLQLAPTGSVRFGPLSGQWHFTGGRLTIASTSGVTVTYHASLDGDGKLHLGGGDLDRELELLRDDSPPARP
jgi:hypothetical protein